jgi:hypothetical protein
MIRVTYVAITILWVIAQTTLEIKYKILTCNTSDDAVKVFKSIA